MKSNILTAAFLALVCSASTACATNDDVDDQHDGIEAGDTGDTGDAGNTECSCLPVAREPMSPFLDGTMGLSCFCEQFSCLTYEQATHPASCSQGRPISYIYADCGLIRVDSGGGYTGSEFIYDSTTHKLVGADTYSDNSSVKCGDTTVSGVTAGTQIGPDCTLTESVPLCR